MTWATATATLHTMITTSTDPVIAGVEGKYDYEPDAGEMLGGVSITIQAIGSDDDYDFLALRIYAQVSIGAKEVQAQLNATHDALENLLEAQDVFERSPWEVEYAPDLRAFVARSILQAAREWS